jgi:SAM-dependent methyltransferase
VIEQPKAPRHALECDLTAEVPGAALRERMAAFYRTNEPYARQQVSHPPGYFDRLLSVMNAVLTGSRLRVLEIGAGSAGALHTFLRQRPAAKGIALELSALSLRAAMQGAETRLAGVAGSALALPFRAGAVDAVFAFEVIEHLPDVARALDELLRVVGRPGHVIIGLPNHASLWTPVEDVVFRRDRRAFGVEAGRGAWRWWRRNALVALRKRLSTRQEFLYRQPILDAAQGGDADAVYYAAPIDLLRFFRRRGARLVATSAGVRFGPIGRLLPVELQGSTVFAWRVD